MVGRFNGSTLHIIFIPAKQCQDEFRYSIRPERAFKMQAWVGLGLLRAWPGLVCGLEVWTAGLTQKPGPRGLRLLVHVVKARARAWTRP
jgi:hypothetical protein